MRLPLALLALPLLLRADVQSGMLVSTSWLEEHKNDRQVVVLHVGANRTGYDAGHIPGARFVAQSELMVTRDGVSNELPPPENLQALFQRLGISDETRVILYSEGSIIPATRAYFTLDYLGHGQHTALLDGGMDQWKRENRALSTEVPEISPGKLTLKVRPEIVAKTEQVRQPVGFTLLDARSENDFKGGHIPSAAQAFWMDVQTTREDTTLQSEAALRRLYQAAGLAPGKPVVTYCNSGMQSSAAYFTLKYLGYDVKMYDGSLAEWNKTPGTTLEK